MRTWLACLISDTKPSTPFQPEIFITASSQAPLLLKLFNLLFLLCMWGPLLWQPQWPRLLIFTNSVTLSPYVGLEPTVRGKSYWPLPGLGHQSLWLRSRQQSPYWLPSLQLWWSKLTHLRDSVTRSWGALANRQEVYSIPLSLQPTRTWVPTTTIRWA